jgi:hypothetical protein
LVNSEKSGEAVHGVEFARRVVDEAGKSRSYTLTWPKNDGFLGIFSWDNRL